MDHELLAYDVYVGIDIGKYKHYVLAQTAKDQKTVLSKEVKQDEKEIRDVLDECSAFGRMLVAVDQKGSIGKLVVVTTKAVGIDIGFLTPNDFYNFSKGYSEVKSDAHDAYIISDVAMRFTHRLFAIDDEEGEAQESLKALCASRKALVEENTRDKNRIRASLIQTHPSLEAIIDRDDLDRAVYLHILMRYGGSEGIRKAGQNKLEGFIAKQPYYKNKASELAERIFGALSMQTVSMPGAAAREAAIKQAAASIIARNARIDTLEDQIEVLYRSFPDSAVLDSVPGVGKVYGPVMLSEIGDIEQYKDAGHLAAYSGTGPSKRQSGKTLDTAKKKVKCNRRLKEAFCQSAWSSVSWDEWSAWYYNKKRAEGKEHRQAILALARHRTDIIYAMLKNGSLYEPKTMKP